MHGKVVHKMYQVQQRAEYENKNFPYAVYGWLQIGLLMNGHEATFVTFTTLHNIYMYTVLKANHNIHQF